MRTSSEIKQALRQQWLETPSWAYGNTGTRFKVFKNPGAARDPYEKIDDAALVHHLTGVAPSVALHIPWDRVDDYGKLAKHAADAGLRIGAINPNVFQEDDYRLGSVCNPDPAIRRKATDHLLECVEIAEEVGSTAVSLWFADGTNYPGQDDIRGTPGPAFRGAQHRLRGVARWHRDTARVQVLRAGLLHDGCARLGHVARALPCSG